MTLTAVLLVATLAPAVVVAQSDTKVGGSVLSFLELSVKQPTGKLAAFPKRGSARDYVITVPAEVTATDAPLAMSIGDGDDLSGAHHGHLTNGAAVLASPLQVSLGSGAFQSLDGAADPSLTSWAKPVTRAPASIRLRQQIGAGNKQSGFHKLLLLTVSIESP